MSIEYKMGEIAIVTGGLKVCFRIYTFINILF